MGKMVATGDVGVGVDNPTTKLDVDGTVKMTGFQLTGSRSAGDVLTSDASGVGTWQTIDEFTLPINDSAATTLIFAGNPLAASRAVPEKMHFASVSPSSEISFSAR